MEGLVVVVVSRDCGVGMLASVSDGVDKAVVALMGPPWLAKDLEW
jgi:hypothetical protein